MKNELLLSFDFCNVLKFNFTSVKINLNPLIVCILKLPEITFKENTFSNAKIYQ